MKKISIALLLLLLPIIAICQNPSGYKIAGTLENFPEGKAYLGKMDGYKLVHVDSTNIKNGKFNFSGSVSGVETYYLQIEGARVYLPFFLEKGQINITGNVEKNTLSVTGTPNNDALTAYNKDYKGLFPSGRMGIPASGGRMNDTLQQKVDALKKAYVEKYNKLDYAAYLLTSEVGYSTTANQIDSLVALLAPSLNESRYVKEMKKKAQTLHSMDPGNPAPEIVLPGENGEKIALSSLRGKYVFIDFWASWCGPCRAEVPHLVKAYEKYHSKGFEIYGVSIDEKPEAWKKAMNDLKMTWVQVIDTEGWNSSVVPQYAIAGIPCTMLLDKEGNIIARNLRGEALEEKLEQLFGL